MKHWKTGLRIIWTIALKDIVDAIRSKTTLSIMIGVALTMLSGQALPWLLNINPKPTAALYDAGDARLVDILRQSDDVRVYKVRSQTELESALTESANAILGLVIPADFDARLAARDAITLEGYAAHWVKMKDIANVQAAFEKKIGDIANQEIAINTATPRLYPAPDAAGHTVMVTLSLVISTVLITIVLVPYLMIDEKETHTLDALLVSPASIGQVTAGKAIAGALYGLLAGSVALLISHTMIAHWWVALLTVVCGTAFAVAVGLLMGSLFDNPQNMGVWMGVVMMLLLVPAFADMMSSENWSAILRAVLLHMPTALMSGLFRVSFAEVVPLGPALGKLALIFAWSVPFYAAVAWRIRRSDR
jgi:ABC-type transport system involved in multi-copper enzyme maturation permease subunit